MKRELKNQKIESFENIESSETVREEETSDVLSKAEDELISFVNIQLKKMDNKLLFDGVSSPSLELLNQALVNHPHIFLALTSLYETYRWETKVAQSKYDAFYAEKFNEVRDEVNTRDIAASKWYSKDEIGYILKTRYSKELLELEAELMSADHKRSFIQRLLDGWSSYQYVLVQLSKNSIAELSSTIAGKYDGEKRDDED